jgi:hypothetical protein
MVVDDLDVFRTAITLREVHAPLVVDADRILSFSVTATM